MKGENELSTFLGAEAQAETKPEVNSLQDILNRVSEVIGSLSTLSADLATVLGKEAGEPDPDPTPTLDEPNNNLKED